jgi:hypothetical protein
LARELPENYGTLIRDLQLNAVQQDELWTFVKKTDEGELKRGQGEAWV